MADLHQRFGWIGETFGASQTATLAAASPWAGTTAPTGSAARQGAVDGRAGARRRHRHISRRAHTSVAATVKKLIPGSAAAIPRTAATM